VVVETSAGVFLVKLRGAAQGLPPIIAEILVGEIATVLGLPVPERAIVELHEDVPSEDRNDELADLLRASHGKNLGFRFLEGATDLRADQLALVDRTLATLTVWLDGLVMNPDRTARNPNILLWHRGPWLIDHGAALGFHHDWSSLTEQTPRERGPEPSAHLLFPRAAPLDSVDADAAKALSRGVLAAAAEAIPADFLRAAFRGERVERLRAAYVAFLWKRLASPRPFI
jgi:hypothetical protein